MGLPAQGLALIIGVDRLLDMVTCTKWERYLNGNEIEIFRII